MKLLGIQNRANNFVLAMCLTFSIIKAQLISINVSQEHLMFITMDRARPMNFHIPRVTEITVHSFFYNATLDRNSLPVNVKSIQNKSAFTSAMKSHLFISMMTHKLAEFV